MFDKGNLDWKTYESITKYIYETLGKESGVEIEGFGNDCKVKGKSGVEHQIDVLTKHSDGIHEYRTAVECKYWKDKINKDIVMKVSEIIEDAGINKGVIVSKSGFTPDGISFAKYKNIGLIELREFEEKDWEGRPRILDIKTWVISPEILNITVDTVGEPDKKSEITEVGNLKIKRSNGIKVPFSDFIETFKKDLKNEKLFHVVTKGYKLIGAKLINTRDNSTKIIRGLIFNGVLTKSEADLKFYPVDQVWLIMRLIFEEKTFTISEKGIIKEDKYG